MSRNPNSFLPFALPQIGEAEISEVVDTLRSGWITTGPKTRQFEADFTAFLGGGVEAVAVNSATAGLHLGLEALGVTSGDDVITPTHTFTATAEVVRYLGAHPNIVDVEPDTLNIDPATLRRAITPRTKAIIPVHFAGLAANMTEITAIADEFNIAILDDAAHALPTTHNGSLIGSRQSLGKTGASVFSFYATKTITTGEGGMLVTANPELASRARVMRLHGISRDAFDRYTSAVPSWQYEVIAPGFKYNMTDISASLGIHQLRRAYEFQARRAAIADFYDRSFKDLPLVLPARPKGHDSHSWHLYVIRLADKCNVGRDAFIERMYASGVSCSVHFIPLHRHPYWRDTYQLKPESFPSSERAWQRSVSLPIYTLMTDADVKRVVDVVRSVVKEC